MIPDLRVLNSMFRSDMSQIADYLELAPTPMDVTLTPSAAAVASSNGELSRRAVNSLIMNYLVTEGFKDAAEKFQEESGVPFPKNEELHHMDTRIQIRDAIQSGKIEDATRMVQEISPELLDDDKYLNFSLQQQQLIELIRENRIEEGLKFACERLAERAEDDASVLEELERTMALMAFEDPSTSPFSDLLTNSHRQKVASELNSALLRNESSERTQPDLACIMKLMLWAQHELDRKGVPYPKVIDLLGGKKDK